MRATAEELKQGKPVKMADGRWTPIDEALAITGLLEVDDDGYWVEVDEGSDG